MHRGAAVTDATAIIAEDEAQLRAHLKSQLAELWPGLTIRGEAENGLEAVALIRQHRPDIAFLDIKMPGLTGIEVAEKTSGISRIVFISAYDQYAIEAFENEAIDYILKPVTPERLEKTISRLQRQITRAPELPDAFTRAMERALLALKTHPSAEYLQWIKVQQGDGVRLIPVDEVRYFKAEDKYTLVVTEEGESLIRKPIKTLSEELDPDLFWRVHRGTIVNVHHISKVHRSFSGQMTIRLKGHADVLTVSKTYAPLFKQM
jgi:DNA-binding LytR/AlgR family response regulator